MDTLYLISDYILSTVKDVDKFTLQRLLFYVQGFYLGMYGKLLFDEDFYAGYMTPAIPELWKDPHYQYQHNKKYLLPQNQESETLFTQHYSKEEQAFIDNVIETYSVFSESDLSNIVLHEDCYRVVRPRTSSHPKCIMSKDDMRFHFMMKLLEHHLREQEYKSGADDILQTLIAGNIIHYTDNGDN